MEWLHCKWTSSPAWKFQGWAPHLHPLASILGLSLVGLFGTWDNAQSIGEWFPGSGRADSQERSSWHEEWLLSGRHWNHMAISSLLVLFSWHSKGCTVTNSSGCLNWPNRTGCGNCPSEWLSLLIPDESEAIMYISVCVHVSFCVHAFAWVCVQVFACAFTCVYVCVVCACAFLKKERAYLWTIQLIMQLM